MTIQLQAFVRGLDIQTLNSCCGGQHFTTRTSKQATENQFPRGPVLLQTACPIPLIVGIDNKVGNAYSGMPDGHYLVGQHGKIAYGGARDPSGFVTLQPSEVSLD